MAWVCKDCGFAISEDKTGDNRCPKCGETMDKKPHTKATEEDFFGDRGKPNPATNLDNPKDILDGQ